ncbi:hypothetical protein GEU84_017425 [Fertoebacter nigrum]|uniref:Tat pathway signal sequence domain protein n=1 Tax=Fertoeibacter niger TaxID=2656921 RepID=A0A8X8H5S0_9RHOB|nr:hypothetical protein [Fertoeibacter niger]NUB46178.1 hypothetical protein [Fertoeibacter niger]
MAVLRAMGLGLALCAAAPVWGQDAPLTGAQAGGAAGAGGGAVQPASASAALVLDLNAVQDAGGACRLIFVAENRLGADLASAVFEAVFFTPDGGVERLTLLDFQDLPQNRRRVRQFDLPDTGCAALGQVLINAATSCEGAGLATGACMAGLTVSSRVAMGISG